MLRVTDFPDSSFPYFLELLLSSKGGIIDPFWGFFIKIEVTDWPIDDIIRLESFFFREGFFTIPGFETPIGISPTIPNSDYLSDFSWF